MSIYYVSAFNEPEATKFAIENSSQPYIQAHDNQWIVSFKGTSKELADKLGFSGKTPNQTGVVMAVSGYHGFAPNDLWEFIAAHWND